LAVVGPVFWKELLEAARRRRTFALRCLIPVLFLVAVFVVAINSSAGPAGYHTPIMQQQNRAGRAFFAAWAVFMTLTVGAAAPMLCGGLIAAERERGSLDLLFTTDLSGREIILGKAVSRIVMLWLLVFASAPALLVVGMLGGVDAGQVLGVLIVTLSGAAFVAAVGLYYSVVTKRPWIAIVRTYFFFALVWLIIPFSLLAGVHALMRVFGTYLRPPFEDHWFLVLNLPFCLATQVEPVFRRLASPLGAALGNALVSWLAAGAFLLLAHWRLREAPTKGPLHVVLAPVRLARRLSARIVRPVARFFSPIAAVVSQRVRLSERRLEQVLDRQPVAWRNLTASVFDPERYLFKIQRFLLILLVVILTLGTMVHGRCPPHDFVVFTLMTMIVLHFLLGVLAAGSISRERERGSLDLLRASLLMPNHLQFGSLVGAVRAVRVSLIAFAVLMAYAIFFEVFSVHFALEYSAVMAVGAACVATQALFISAAAPNTTTAMATAVGVGFLWWIGPLFFVAKETRPWALGIVAALIPIAFLPQGRRPPTSALLISGSASMALFFFVGMSRFEAAGVPGFVCGVVALLAVNWLRSPYAPARLIAVGVCCVTLPIAIGLIGCMLFGVDLRTVDRAIVYPRFIVDVDTSQFYVDSALVRRGSAGWSGGNSERNAFFFFLSTLISTIILYRISLRSFPKLAARD